MRNKIFTIIFLLITTILSAQSVQNSVISFAGETFSPGGYKMDFTMGEIMIETFEKVNIKLTQGFHQTKLIITSVDEFEVFKDILIYPNPANDVLHIEIPKQYNSMKITMYDASGKILYALPEVSGIVHVSTEKLASGTYFLQLYCLEKKEQKTFNIIKIH